MDRVLLRVWQVWGWGGGGGRGALQVGKELRMNKSIGGMK